MPVLEDQDWPSDIFSAFELLWTLFLMFWTSQVRLLHETEITLGLRRNSSQLIEK